MLTFSTFVYLGVNGATQRALEIQNRRMETQFKAAGISVRPFRQAMPFDTETLYDIRERTLSILLVVNIGVLVIAGGFGYVLAGITLKPIELMLQKQKRFISDAAHELKTPLTAMKTDLEVTLRDKNLNLDKSKASLVSAIEEIDKLHGFTTGLLKQSRYQLGNGQSRTSELNIAALLEKTCARLTNIASEKGVGFKTKFSDVLILGDATELEELFMNLIDNAIKYSKNDSTVEICVDKLTKNAVITIADTGIGIDEKDLQNIFEPFYRGDVSRNKSTYEGFGLGLAIAKEIVLNHGGHINATSIVGTGTTFTVTLPIAMH